MGNISCLTNVGVTKESFSGGAGGGEERLKFYKNKVITFSVSLGQKREKVEVNKIPPNCHKIPRSPTPTHYFRTYTQFPPRKVFNSKRKNPPKRVKDERTGGGGGGRFGSDINLLSSIRRERELFSPTNITANY